MASTFPEELSLGCFFWWMFWIIELMGHQGEAWGDSSIRESRFQTTYFGPYESEKGRYIQKNSISP
jgi:hypothetical protein